MAETSSKRPSLELEKINECIGSPPNDAVRKLPSPSRSRKKTNVEFKTLQDYEVEEAPPRTSRVEKRSNLGSPVVPPSLPSGSPGGFSVKPSVIYPTPEKPSGDKKRPGTRPSPHINTGRVIPTHDRFMHTTMPSFFEAKPLKQVTPRHPEIEKQASNISSAEAKLAGHKEFKKLIEEVGLKVAFRFRNVRDAFRFCDEDKDAGLGRSEFRRFFRSFNIDSERADRFFNFLDVDQDGFVDYSEFRQFFGKFVQPEYGTGLQFNHGSGAQTARGFRETTSKENFVQDLNNLYNPRVEVHQNYNLPKNIPEDIKKVCQLIGEKAPQRFRTVREAFRFIDQDHDGKVDLQEVRLFFKVFNIPESAADRLFKFMDTSLDGAIDYNEFVNYFGPYIQPGYQHQARGQTKMANTKTNYDLIQTPQRVPPATLAEHSAQMYNKVTPIGGQRDDMQKMLRVVTEKGPSKWREAKQVFKYIDQEAFLGFVTRDETRKFLSHFGIPPYTADLLFKILDEDKDGRVDFKIFHDFFAPYVQQSNVVKVKKSRRVPLTARGRIQREKNSNAVSRRK